MTARDTRRVGRGRRCAERLDEASGDLHETRAAAKRKVELPRAAAQTGAGELEPTR